MRIADPRLADVCYRALVERSPEYAGMFFVGVKTTSVFCISTCRARKPKRENVEFFTTFDDALAAGYRPCKICRPTRPASEPPAAVARALALVGAHPHERISDDALRAHGIGPESLRRWFARHYGMTFHAYQRMLRIDAARQTMRDGARATDAAFDAGYGSLSGFAHTFRKIFGDTPMQGAHANTIVTARFTTPLGPMFVGATDNGVCLLEFVDRRTLAAEFADLERLLGARVLVGENRHTRQAQQEIAEYFAGARQRFDVALDAPGTAFQRAAWRQLLTVPYARTASYQEQARKLGSPLAVRAVAAANGANRISIIVPCHRIIGKDGALTGYGGGLERKRWLLEHERRHADVPLEAAESGRSGQFA
ncbi:methylated-DNA-[]-cysteine S-methyltransferase family protein [Burkholderia thailandensis MSMB121]|uniref:bifunctional transcriptional activator/DNA repair enzyme AdaA n=1 Tax=Burkholderia humptydooensis TaxID=430531 RepID=UPI000328110E|nr:methylated-DNA--[protein]-cysteine S-methyltransferase [Burkholderia humptydooensis]AGK48495.1 methylated-DNA-[]-cysteine S-methyltransferase family protein [Burkholderia thailandensis MSMB121]ATF35438.1 XRE family transcriptional regulator [Burkholderia thailandensis]KST72840.1 XRE family transcriptional regulator [Burkholderia humptydooensis]